MSKCLDMLEILKHDESIANNGAYVPIIKTIEKELKALEVIIEEHLIPPIDMIFNLGRIEKESYDLLKEVLL